MFCMALKPLLGHHQECLRQLEDIRDAFPVVMEEQMEKMWAVKLGLGTYDKEIVRELEMLMMQTPVDYTIFFRELSLVPEAIEPLKKSFYSKAPEEMLARWSNWFLKWKSFIDATPSGSRDAISRQMKLVNPKYILREWFVVPAYQEALKGDYTLMRELNEVMTRPYDEQSEEIVEKYYKLKPSKFLGVGGLSFLSCSS
jgi:uncharacterized protein YdiU (UPF0061 family)